MKQKVYLVVSFNNLDNDFRVEGVYSNKRAADKASDRISLADRLINASIHVIKKSVQGTEIIEGYGYNDTKTDFVLIHKEDR